jgi:septum formation protein
MVEMSEQQIRTYEATGQSEGKAGAYGFQEHGDPYVRDIKGSFSNILGLPLELLKEYLQQMEHSEGESQP